MSIEPDKNRIFLPDEIGIFVGHAADADAETKAVCELANGLQEELRNIRKVASVCTYTSVKFWEWNEDAHCGVGGQSALIDPAIEQAAIAVFIFKDRIGKVSWNELEKCRDRRIPVIAVFPEGPSNKDNFSDINYMKSWLELLGKKRKLTEDWTSNVSRAIRPVDDYRDTLHCKNIVFKRLKDTMRKILGNQVAARENTVKTDTIKPYLDYQLQANRFLPMQGFETTLRVPIELERVYVCMRANVGGFKFGGGRHSEAIFKRSGKRASGSLCIDELQGNCPGEAGLVDIKGAFEALNRLNVRDMIILGDPGSGKTTLLKYILVTLLEDKGKEKLGIETDLTPLLAPLRDLKDPDKESFEGFLHRAGNCSDFGIGESTIKDLLTQGKAIVLLDGLDEVADEEARVRTCRWIDSARRRSNINTRFIVSSRFAGYLGRVRLEGLPVLVLSIQDFTPAEVNAFLERWFETVYAAVHPGMEAKWRESGRKEAGKLIEDIEKSEHVKKLAVNPLLLQIIALVRFDRGTRLPERRVELYQECVDVLLEKWDMAKGLPVMVTAKQARKILQPLALWLHGVEGRRSATLDELEGVVRASLDSIGKSALEPGKLLRNIRDRSGIFMGYGAEEYGFTHLSFQEYLTAEQIRNVRKIGLLLENYGVEWWREVILLVLGLDNPSIIEEFMQGIVKSDHFKRDITIVQDGIKDSIEKPVKPFAEALTDSTISPEARQNAIRVLEAIGGDTVVTCLREAAEGKDNLIAKEAYNALERLGKVEGVKKPKEEKPPRIRWEKDRADMVLVPAGTFLYGSKVDDKAVDNDEKPQQSILLQDFYIDAFPVTNEQYCRFLNDAKPDKIKLQEWVSIGEEGSFGEKSRLLLQKGNFGIEPGHERHPVIMVSWFGAMAYAEWAGKRLPFEVEWEKAARGTDGRRYPWGDAWDADKCNCERKNKGTTEIERFKNGVSPYGCFDMAGNVWEWCVDWYSTNNEKDAKNLASVSQNGSMHVLRGGSWSDSRYYCRCAYRDRNFPGLRGNFIGFRCVR